MKKYPCLNAEYWGKNEQNTKNCSGKRVKFILRVDDFPRWDLPLKIFQNFDAILAEFGIEYCLGVTPRIATDPLNPFSDCDTGLSDEATTILNDISGRVDIALHGLTHRVQSLKIKSEFRGLSSSVIEKYIVDGINLLKKLDVGPLGFIPPFNSISISALSVSNGSTWIVSSTTAGGSIPTRSSPNSDRDKVYVECISVASSDTRRLSSLTICSRAFFAVSTSPLLLL